MQHALLLFTKFPELGHVKTRLTEGEDGLSPGEATDLYSAILLDLFDLMSQVADSFGARLYVAYSPPNREHEIQELFKNRSVPVSFFFQEGKTIEEKISHAFEAVFSDGNDVAVLGFGDQPSLDKSYFSEAFRILQRAADQGRSHLVLGPNCDGGIHLMGLTRSLRAWFPRALRNTNPCKAVSELFLRASSAHIPCTVIDESLDLDDILDLRLLKTETLPSGPRTLRVLRSLKLKKPSLRTTVSVIIPTLNEERTLENTILSVRAQKFAHVEVVVVDGGSHDRTLEIANRWADRVILVRSRGRQHQENVGARGSKGSVLVFLHGDMTAPPNLLQSVTQALEDPHIMGGGAHLVYSPQKLRYRAICILREMFSDLLDIFGIGAAFFVRRDAFHAMGGFDEEVNEEGVNMSKRIRKQGRMVMLDVVVQTSARRYERSGFIRTFCGWTLTVVLAYFGVHSHGIERYVWRVVR